MLLLVSVLLVILTATNCYAAISVGASIGGGTVFCVSDTLECVKNCTTTGSGDYGLVMANVDQANFDSNPKHGMAWYLPTNAQSDDDGATNNQTIVAEERRTEASSRAKRGALFKRRRAEAESDEKVKTRSSPTGRV